MAISTKTHYRILTVIGLYYLLCATSAIFAPVLWIMVAEIPLDVSPQNTLLFGVIGAYMSTASYVAFVAARSVPHRTMAVKSLLLANYLDAFVTGRAILAHVLPLGSGGLFMATIMTCIIALWYVLRKAEEH